MKKEYEIIKSALENRTELGKQFADVIFDGNMSLITELLENNDLDGILVKDFITLRLEVLNHWED